MGTSLTGLKIKNTYKALLKFGDNDVVSASLKQLSDGLGGDLPLYISSTSIGITGTVTLGGSVGTSGQVLTSAGAGLSPTWTTLSSTLLAISAGSTTAPNSIYNLTATIPVIFKSSDGNTMLYLDETNERIGIGQTPSYKLDVLSSDLNLAKFQRSGQKNLYIVGDSGGSGIFSGVNETGVGVYLYDTSQFLALYTNSTEKVRITNDGSTIISSNGIASTPILTGTGTWFTGGTATTTKPYWLIEPTGTTSTGWSTSGTGLGVNAAIGFTGNLIDAQVAGSSIFNVKGSGVVQINSTSTTGTLMLQALAGTSGIVLHMVSNADGGINFTGTYGDNRHPILIQSTFAPTSGTGAHNGFHYAEVIHQTGGANGITRGIYINPTLTAAADFRAIDVAAGSFALPYVAKTGTYSILNNDYAIDCTTGTFTVTLPTAVGCSGRIYVIKNTGAGVITIATTSSQTIDDVTTQSLSSQYSSYTVQSNGANWIII